VLQDCAVVPEVASQAGIIAEMRIFVPGFRCFLHQVLQTCALLPEVASEATISAELRIFDSGFRHFVLVQSERQLLGPVL